MSAQASEDPLFDGLRIERDGSEIEARCDAAALRSVLFNLLRNAAEALRGAGSITISTVRLPPPQGCMIVVRDTGPGMPPHVRAHAFDLFFTTKEGGTGVGLALARRVLELHDWKVSLRSPTRGGTEVVIEIPESDIRQEPPHVSTHPLGKRERTGNVLVVEDDIASCRLLADFLAEQGFRSRGTANSDEALTACREFAPDVLLSDWSFKDGKNGIFVARELLRRYPNMAVVFQSGLDARDLERRLHGERIPVHRILTKPISLVTLPGILVDAQRSVH